MKVRIVLPDEYDFIRDALADAFEGALSEVESGGRPEFAAGMMKATKAIIESVEGGYEGKKHRLREVESA